MTLRIMIVDDHEVVRLGLRALLERHRDFQVVGEAGTAREALQKALLHKPDVVVMDIRLPGRSGIEACRDIVAKLPETKVIMLTSYAEDELLFDAISAGACGYVLKQIGTDDLVRAIETVGRGEALLDPAVTHRVFERVRDRCVACPARRELLRTVGLRQAVHLYADHAPVGLDTEDDRRLRALRLDAQARRGEAEREDLFLRHHADERAHRVDGLLFDDEPGRLARSRGGGCGER